MVIAKNLFCPHIDRAGHIVFTLSDCLSVCLSAKHFNICHSFSGLSYFTYIFFVLRFFLLCQYQGHIVKN